MKSFGALDWATGKHQPKYASPLPPIVGRLCLNTPSVLVVIVNFRTPNLVIENLSALASQRCSACVLSATIVDGGSEDGSVEALSKVVQTPKYRDWVRLLALPINGGFGYANNQAILDGNRRGEEPDLIWFLNPDAQPLEGALDGLLAEMCSHPEAAAVGSQLLGLGGRLAGSAFRFPTVAREFARGHRIGTLARAMGVRAVLIQTDYASDVGWVTGASVLIRSAALRECGLFDDGFFLYFEEVELMRRMRAAGWTIRFSPKSRVMHDGGASTGMKDVLDDRHPAPPYYWFDSHRRYFALSYGRRSVFWARAMWLVGDLVWRVAARAARLGDANLASAERSALFRDGVHAKSGDSTACRVHWGDAPGALPGWMRKQ